MQNNYLIFPPYRKETFDLQQNDEQSPGISAAHPESLVGSVCKALSILECFTATQPEQTLSQISRQLSLPKSTALNLIRTLESGGYLLKNLNGQTYRLGYKILELSYFLRASLPITQYAMPFLEELQVKTEEAIYLTSHINGRVLYLEGMYPSTRFGNFSISGKTLPMHCTSCGKAMLAYLPEQETRQIIERWGLHAKTQNTITDPERLSQELEAIRRRGYATDLEEETLGVKCIGMAIRNSEGYPTGAISISGTVISMRDELLDYYAKMLARVCSVFIPNANQLPAAQMRAEEWAL